MEEVVVEPTEKERIMLTAEMSEPYGVLIRALLMGKCLHMVFD